MKLTGTAIAIFFKDGKVHRIGYSNIKDAEDFLRNCEQSLGIHGPLKNTFFVYPGIILSEKEIRDLLAGLPDAIYPVEIRYPQK